MKKIILSFAFLCILHFAAQAQGLYLGGGLGYGMRAGGMVLGSNQNSDGSSTIMKGSYGAGITPHISIGYLFSRNAGVELTVGHLFGRRTMTFDAQGNASGVTLFSANSFYLNPSFVFRAAGEGDNFFVPYAKVGMFLGLANSGYQFSHTDFTTSPDNELTGVNETEFKVRGGIATGFTSALGVDVMLSNRFAVFGELNGRLASWAPSSYTVTTTTTDYEDGVPQESDQSSVSGNFVKRTPDNYTGTDTPTQVFPFSSIGFNVGVKIFFGQ